MVNPEGGPSPEKELSDIESEAKAKRSGFLNMLKPESEATRKEITEAMREYRNDLDKMSDQLYDRERTCWVLYQQTVTLILAARLEPSYNEERDVARNTLYEMLDAAEDALGSTPNWIDRFNNPQVEMNAEASRLGIPPKNEK